MMPIRRKRSPEERREQILQTAGALFAERGFERTTTKDIARTADISEGTIYKYFENKQAILFTLVKGEMLGTITELFAEREDVDDAIIIKTLIRTHFENSERHGALIHNMISALHLNPALMQEYYQSLTRPALRLMEEYIERRIAAGVFRQVNPSVVVRSLLGTLRFHHLIWEQMLGGKIDAIPREELIDEIATLFLRGVQKDPGVGV
jgi:AcrR family transcriptional regulator